MKTEIKFILAGIVAITGLTATSCVNAYRVDGTGHDWSANPVQVLPANRVVPIVTVPLPDDVGGGTIDIPIDIQSGK